MKIATEYLGREVIQTMKFNVPETFDSYYAAVGWAKQAGYDAGSMSFPHPTALMRGDYYSYGLPHKWKNFTKNEIRSVHGVIIGNFREGPVTVHLFQ